MEVRRLGHVKLECLQPTAPQAAEHACTTFDRWRYLVVEKQDWMDYERSDTAYGTWADGTWLMRT